MLCYFRFLCRFRCSCHFQLLRRFRCLLLPVPTSAQVSLCFRVPSSAPGVAVSSSSFVGSGSFIVFSFPAMVPDPLMSKQIKILCGVSVPIFYDGSGKSGSPLQAPSAGRVTMSYRLTRKRFRIPGFLNHFRKVPLPFRTDQLHPDWLVPHQNHFRRFRSDKHSCRPLPHPAAAVFRSRYCQCCHDQRLSALKTVF